MNIVVRTAFEGDLDELDRIFRLAFGAYLRMPEFPGNDSEIMRNRWSSDPEGLLAAEVDGRLAGSNFLTRWGSFGFFGPLTVLPEYWGKKVASALLESTVQRFDEWGLSRTGLYTFPDSTKHVWLYQKFGYWPGHLTLMMSKPLSGEAGRVRWEPYDGNGDEVAAFTGRVFQGLDVWREMENVRRRSLGETLLLRRRGGLEGVAVCHVGKGSEAGSGVCYVRFGTALTAAGFGRLLAACETYATGVGAERLRAGVNTGRTEAYRAMLDAGFRARTHGIAMERGSGRGYNRPGVFVLDDWQ